MIPKNINTKLNVTVAVIFTLVVLMAPAIHAQMTVRYKDRVISASQVGQTTAIRIVDDSGKTKQEKVPVTLWSAVPFHVGKTIMGLALGTIDMGYKDFYFPSERVIEIEDSDVFFLLPSKNSQVPIWINLSGGEMTQEILVRAANVTWVFKKAGMKFETISHCYVTKKPKARILFRRDGVKFDGITVTEKKPKK